MMVASPPDLDSLLRAAREAEAIGRAAEALGLAWRALDRAPQNVDAKALVARLLRRNPNLTPVARRGDLAQLLVDPIVDPTGIAPAGWLLLLADRHLPAPPEDVAAWAEADELARALLREAPVAVPEAERALTAVRRWLLLSERWRDFPLLIAALGAQAAHNHGAWLRDDEEEALLAAAPDGVMAPAYEPAPPAVSAGPGFADPVTDAVADQYRRWPFPAWTRAAARPPRKLPEVIAKLDGGRSSCLPVRAEILVAGCGTGREAAATALRYPDARVTAIDISATSLAYAAERCAAAGIGGVDFGLCDLHDVSDLGRDFDFIVCSGVLHHLPDPEAGWAALVAVLKPGGAMRIMVYSKIARLIVRAARTHIADLLDRPIDAGLLRAVRRRLLEKAPGLVSNSPDFYTLAGVYDLLLHSHEDPFDVPRIARALDSLGLELLAFELPNPHLRTRYREAHPDDAGLRDVKAWAALEKSQPFLFAGMYDFWCRKPAV